MTYQEAKQVIARKATKPLTDEEWKRVFEAEKVMLANGDTSNQATYDWD